MHRYSYNLAALCTLDPTATSTPIHLPSSGTYQPAIDPPHPCPIETTQSPAERNVCY